MASYVCLLDPAPTPDPLSKAMSIAKDSTLSSSALNVVGGYVLGFGFSIFGSMISAETSTQSMGTADFFRHSLKSAHRMSCSFAYFGFVFSGIEIALEKRRGKRDRWNPTLSGGIMGAAYGWRCYRYSGFVAFGVAAGAASMMFEYLLDRAGFGTSK